MSLVISGQAFRTKSAVAQKAKSILNSYPLGKAISPDDQKFVMALLSMRKEDTIRDKIGPGVSHISVMLTRNGNYRVFCIHRIDKTITDFSYSKSLSPNSHAPYVKKAARYEIRDQIVWYRDTFFAGLCEITGKPIEISNCHVDHIPPDTFDVLFARFLKSKKIKIDDVEVTNVGDFQIGNVFIDRCLAAEWYSYHLENAHLRIVDAKQNCSLSKVLGDYS